MWTERSNFSDLKGHGMDGTAWDLIWVGITGTGGGGGFVFVNLGEKEVSWGPKMKKAPILQEYSEYMSFGHLQRSRCLAKSSYMSAMDTHRRFSSKPRS